MQNKRKNTRLPECEKYESSTFEGLAKATPELDVVIHRCYYEKHPGEFLPELKYVRNSKIQDARHTNLHHTSLLSRKLSKKVIGYCKACGKGSPLPVEKKTR